MESLCIKDVIYIVLTTIIAILALVSYVPQIVKLLKTKHSEDLSLGSYIMYDVGYILYTVIMIMDDVGPRLLFIQISETSLCVLVTILIVAFRIRE